jgi:hypothetical protein
MSADITDTVYDTFKSKMQQWIHASYPNLSGFDRFTHCNIINGCTQFIDNIYMQGKVQVFRNDYRYHFRLGLAHTIHRIDDLVPGVQLILASPFPATGDVQTNFYEILDHCRQNNIPVHIDGAWVTCSKQLDLDLSHPAIHSVGISLSKGLGLGWNRIGLRWSFASTDSVEIMNNFHMNNRALAIVGNHFLDHLEPNYLWSRHGDAYYKICNDFNLVPTNSIHIALNNGSPVGVSPLIRYLENHEI